MKKNTKLNINIELINKISGFLEIEEGKYLYNLALKASKHGPCLEIGSYCGKSTLYIGLACKNQSTNLFSIDHHKGSEEHQFGEEYFDLNLFDYSSFTINTFETFKKNIYLAKLENAVVPIVSKSKTVAKAWKTPLSMIFIDGSHTYKNSLSDFIHWHKHIIHKGFIAFHDIFKNPKNGGSAPYKAYKLALSSGLFIKYKTIKSLGIIKRTNKTKLF